MQSELISYSSHLHLTLPHNSSFGHKSVYDPNSLRAMGSVELSVCNTTLDKDQLDAALVIMASAGGASVLVCTLAVLLVVLLRLYRQFAYRLALYQVFAAGLFGVVCCLEVIFTNYDKDSATYSSLCQGIASMFLTLEWVKLMFTTCLTFHLFCFAVFNKNFKKLEMVYITCSIVIPVAVAAIPHLTQSYGRAGAWCWIRDWVDNCPSEIFAVGNVETFALWYGPAVFLLTIDSLAMVMTGTVLACRARGNGPPDRLHSSNVAHKNALKQMLPLIAYPIVFFAFVAQMLAFRLYSARPHFGSNDFLLNVTALLSPVAGLAAGLVLVLHILVAKCKIRSAVAKRRESARRKLYGAASCVETNDDLVTCKSEPPPMRSTTQCSQLNESEVDRGQTTGNRSE